MVTLVLSLPRRSSPATFAWHLVAPTGVSEGESAPDALPPADELVLLLAEQAVTWLRAPLPRAPRKQLRAALVGALEDHLLDDPETLHVAVPESAAPGEPTWVAVTALAPLQDAVQRLEAAGRVVDRIVPRTQPAETNEAAQAHVVQADTGPLLRYAHADGVAHLPLAGELLRRVLPADLRVSASAAATAAAEAWRGAPVPLVTDADDLQRSLGSRWNLRQGPLAPQLHGLRWVQQAFHRFLQPDWRATRIGLGLLAVLALGGLNLSAWQHQRTVRQQQLAMEAALKQAFPQVAYVADAPLQMQRELNGLRARAGALGDQDLEVVLAALASAWPAERGPIEALNFENGRLSWPASGWGEAQLAPLRHTLAASGWTLTQDAGRLTLQRSRP